MPREHVLTQIPTCELRKNGDVVGLTDRVYDLAGTIVHIDEILVTGDLSGELSYNGKLLKILEVNTVVGMLVDQRGARGPVWKDVQAQVVD